MRRLCRGAGENCVGAEKSGFERGRLGRKQGADSSKGKGV